MKEGRCGGRGAAGIAVLAIGAVLSGCAGGGGNGGGGGGGGGGQPPAAGCTSQVPGNPISFKNNIQPIFNRSCALAGCHIPPIVNSGLNLTPGRAYRDIVGVASLEVPSLKRVKPGDPDNSYLYQKIIGMPGIAGVLMPLGCPGAPSNGAQCPTPDEKDAIRTWILECAPRN